MSKIRGPSRGSLDLSVVCHLLSAVWFFLFLGFRDARNERLYKECAMSKIRLRRARITGRHTSVTSFDDRDRGIDSY